MAQLRLWEFGVGICGPSGSGKSDLCLSLLDRGHQLVADDALNLTVKNGEIFGSAVEDCGRYLHIRGLGVIDVQALYGDAAVIPSWRLDFVVQLSEREDADLAIDAAWGDMLLCGVRVDSLVLPVGRGRELPVLVETIAKLYRQRQLGQAPAAVFRQRVSEMLNREVE